MKKLKSFLYFLMAITIAMFLNACGGGGSSSTGGTTPAVTGSSYVGSVGGTVSVSGDAQVTGASVGDIVKADTALFDNQTVEIKSYDDKGNLIDTVIANIKNGRFDAPVKLWNLGGTVVVSIKKDGFSEYNKSFEYKSGDNVTNFDIQSVLTRLDVSKVVPLLDNMTISKSGEKILSIYVVKDRKGVSTVRFGNVKISAGDNVTYKMDIPVGNLDNNLKLIKAEIKNFDPKNPNDMNSFPSERDNSGDKLITAGFDFSKLTNAETGGSIFSQTAVSRVRKSADEALAYVYKQVYCDNLLGDMDPGSADKYDVNVYVLKNDVWKLIGTAYVADGYNNSNPKKTSDVCKNGSTYEYMYIGITDPDFKWVNLDYPLSWLSSKTVEKCVDLEFRDQDNKSIEQWISFNYKDDDDNTSFTSGYGYANNGKGKISVLLKENDNDNSLDVTYYDPYSFKYETIKNLEIKKKSDGCAKTTITINNPYQCTLEGYVKDSDNKSVPSQVIYVYDNETNSYIGNAYTDSNGYYSRKVSCNKVLKVEYYSYTNSQSKYAKVDSVKGYNEVSDNNSIVRLEDFTKTNEPPYAYGYLSTNQRKASGSHKIYFYAYDPEGDSITYEVYKGNSLLSTGTWSGYNYKEIEDKDNTTGTFTYKIKVKDSNNGWKEFTIGTIEINADNSNRKPVISYFYGTPQSGREGYSSTVYFYYYDLDNDNLTATLNGCGINSVIDNSSLTIQINNNCTLTLTVSDGNDNVSKSINFTAYENRKPVINTWSEKNESRIGSSIKVYSSGYDPDGDNVSIQWSVAGNDNCTIDNATQKDAVITCSVPGTYDVTVTYTDNYIAPAFSQQTFKLTFKDNQAPIVNITFSNSTPKPGDNVTITCSATDPEGDGIASYKIYVDNVSTNGNIKVLAIPINTPDGTTYKIRCEATDNFTLSPKTGSKEVNLIVTTVPTYGNITITNKK